MIQDLAAEGLVEAFDKSLEKTKATHGDTPPTADRRAVACEDRQGRGNKLTHSRERDRAPREILEIPVGIMRNLGRAGTVPGPWGRENRAIFAGCAHRLRSSLWASEKKGLLGRYAKLAGWFSAANGDGWGRSREADRAGGYQLAGRRSRAARDSATQLRRRASSAIRSMIASSRAKRRLVTCTVSSHSMALTPSRSSTGR